MDFTLSPEQLLIKDSVARFAQGTHAGGDHWKTFGELGWLAIGAPEDLGGFGGPVETLLLMEQFGRGLVVAPYVSQVVFAGAILRAAERLDRVEQLAEGTHRFTVAYEEPGARYDPSVVATTASADGKISGKKARVLDPSTANSFIVSARTGDEIGLYLVPADAAGVTIATYAAEDGHDVGDVTFADAPGERIAGNGLALLQTGLEHATAALCAEGLGLMSLMLE
ncbi:MAG TPA: acyl-CoA dehydrogenase family protein, partial [Candidatus Elarobacter sp.]